MTKIEKKCLELMTFIFFKLFSNEQKVASLFRLSVLTCMHPPLGSNGWGGKYRSEMVGRLLFTTIGLH
jgi:hypothetical protein